MKYKTTAAEASSLIRKELKKAFPDIKFSVRSNTYSMGDSININYTGLLDSKEVELIVKKYQEGSFNGMEDIYEYDNIIEGLPQVKYVFVKGDLPEAFKIEMARIYDKYWIDGFKYDVTDDGFLQINDDWDNRQRFYRFIDEILQGKRNRENGHLIED